MTRFISKIGGNWSDASCWRCGIVPSIGDDIVATHGSGNVTIDSTAQCRSIDLSQYNYCIQIHNITADGMAITLLASEEEVMDYVNSNIT